MKLKSSLLALALSLFLIASCACAGDPSNDNADPSLESESSDVAEDVSSSSDVVVALPGEKSEFVFAYDAGSRDSELIGCFKQMRDAFKRTLGAALSPLDDYEDAVPFEIVFGSKRRPLCAELMDSLEVGEYAIKAVKTDDSVSILIAYNGDFARSYALQYFISEFVKEDGVIVPADTFIKEKCELTTILSSIDYLRDPCLIIEDGVYYVYGTGWQCYKNTSGSLEGKWKNLGVVATIPDDAADNYWAPEVHKYNGEFYMFTTYKSRKTGHRGCTILKSSSPEGPFVEITDGAITPSDWDAIDGTFYVDEDGQPWMIFVHEWTSTDDGVGRMAAAKLSDDLTTFISEPIELFRADSSSWTKHQVTDGCWMYKCENGELLMLWSNCEPDGSYAVGIARSDNGKVDGNWSHDYLLFYSKSMNGDYDGGHGMIFTDTDGQMYLCIHSPNAAVGDRKEKPTFIPICEKNGVLLWD